MGGGEVSLVGFSLCNIFDSLYCTMPERIYNLHYGNVVPTLFTS